MEIQLDAELEGLGVLQGPMGEIDLASLISGSEVHDGGFLMTDSPFGMTSTGTRGAAGARARAGAGGDDKALDREWDDAPVSVLQVLLDLKVRGDLLERSIRFMCWDGMVWYIME